MTRAAADTESRRPDLGDLDERPLDEVVALFVDEEIAALQVLRGSLGPLTLAIEETATRFAAGGRLVYAGAGTSGRLAQLDAAECGPTFGLGPDRVLAVTAGGPDSFRTAVEDAEDDEPAARADVEALGLGPTDSFVALSASGRTPYTVEAARAARSSGAFVVGIACNVASPLAREVDIAVEAPVGPALLAGSTRLAAGTVQKVLLNALSTLVMMRTGRTYGNLMVDLHATNAKLRERARRLVSTIASVDDDTAARLLSTSDGEVKTAVVVSATGLPPDGARELLSRHGGRLRAALQTPPDPTSQEEPT